MVINTVIFSSPLVAPTLARTKVIPLPYTKPHPWLFMDHPEHTQLKGSEGVLRTAFSLPHPRGGHMNSHVVLGMESRDAESGSCP